MLNILGMIILIIIIFIIILLLAGIKIKLEYNKKGSEVKGCLKILIFKKIKIYSLNFPSQNTQEENSDDEEDEEEKERDIKKIFNLAKPCIKDLLDYLKTIIKSIKIKTLKNHIVFGMESYADTGKYIGILWAIFSILNPMHEKLKLTCEPSFTGSVLDGKGINEFEIYPLKLVIPTVKLISKKQIRKLIRGVLDER